MRKKTAFRLIYMGGCLVILALVVVFDSLAVALAMVPWAVFIHVAHRWTETRAEEASSHDRDIVDRD